MSELWVMADPVFFVAESYLDHGCAHLANVELIGAAQLYRAASSDRLERG